MNEPEGSAAQLVGRLVRQQGALVALARRNLATAGSLDDSLYDIVRTAADTLGVERVSVWMLTPDRKTLECRVLHERSRERRSGGMSLSASDYPRYFAALDSGRALDASDAREDPRTSEFREGYLMPLGITSMMDAAVRLEGKVAGVVCHEHVGPQREWTADEVSFAGAIADQVALVLAEAQRRVLEDERTRVTQAMLHAQKLESLGLLAGGIAHDFNNLLTVILGNAALAASAPEDPRARRALDELVRAAQHAAHLTRQLLAYSGRAPAAFEPVDLAEQTREISTLVKPSLPPSVRLTLNLPEDLPYVRADVAQIQQVVMNLLLNAGEAIGDRGRGITVSARVREVTLADRPCLTAGEIGPGTYVELEVCDEGVGVPPSDIDKIFDPFFSTKGAGRGLGLAAVLGIARAHGGALCVDSALGEGTTFRFMLPATDAPQRASTEPPSPATTAKDITVLVVDDQRSVRLTTVHLLKELGYDAREAASGPEAIAAYRSAGSRIDIVLLDMTMPDQSGVQTFEALSAEFPEACVILMSGYDESEATQGLLDRGLAGFLQKPFTPEQLDQALHRALRRKARASRITN